MTDKIEMNLLIDFYGDLLTKRQLHICNMYYHDDLSLQEIAEIENISRSAVHDIIKRSRDELVTFESTLGYISSFKKRIKIYEKIKKLGYKDVNKLIDSCIKTEIEGGYYD